MIGQGVTVERLGPGGRAEWEAFTASRDETELAHEWGFQELLLGTFGLATLRLVARDRGGISAILPLVLQQSLLGRFLTSVPYLNHAGVLGSDAASRAALGEEALRVAGELRVDRLELRGRRGDDLPIETWPGKIGHELALPVTTDELWRQLGSKLRAQVQRPLKDGYEATVVARDGRREFYPLLSRRWHELGSPVLPASFFRNLEELCGDRFDYVVVRSGARAVAAGLLLHVGSRVEIAWAATAIEHNRFGVNMLLYWTALARAIARGARSFDFGRSTADTGTARFKRQWGANETPLLWNVAVRSRRGRGAERGQRSRGIAAALWRRTPAPLAGRLGPLLAARIPL